MIMKLFLYWDRHKLLTKQNTNEERRITAPLLRAVNYITSN